MCRIAAYVIARICDAVVITFVIGHFDTHKIIKYEVFTYVFFSRQF